MIQDTPRTMTLSGLQFLQALAAQRSSGCFLEIGPLFGSSTGAIDAGRADKSVPIHTIDTFDPAPWIVSRLGQNLSRDAFEKYTSHIENLNIHQGFAPDVVKDVWADQIGFYFDDATHGDPGWTDNFTFFEPFFTEDAIICGDDFAGGWPHIVRNVYHLSNVMGAKLFVVGRVWAFTQADDWRISDAIDSAFPRLKGVALEVQHGDQTRSNLAASWSWGLHRSDPLSAVRVIAQRPFTCGLTIEHWDARPARRVDLLTEPAHLQGAKSVRIHLRRGYSMQFCVSNARGKTINTKDLRDGAEILLEQDETITALRLSHR